MKTSFLKITQLTIFVISCFIIMNCENENMGEEIPAQAEFTADNAGPNGVTIMVGECVVFEDRSSGDIGALFWDFEGGDPPTSDEDFRVSVCYDTPGKYDVSLSVNAGEDRITKQDFVCVLEKEPDPLDADFSNIDDLIVIGSEFSLKDESLGSPDSWSWRIDGEGGTFTSQDQNPSFTIDIAGNYDVTLTIKRLQEEDTEVKVSYVDVLDYIDLSCRINNTSASDGFNSTNFYNGENQLSRQDIFIGQSFIGYNLYDWNPDGLLNEVQSFNPSDSIISIEQYGYTEEGILKNQQFLLGNRELVTNYDFFIDQGIISSANIQQPDGQGGFFEHQRFYEYADTLGGNIVRENIIFNGLPGGHIEYEFDNNPRAFFELKVEPFPNRFLINNIKRTTSVALDGTITFESVSVFQYNEFGRPSSESKTTGGNTVDFTFTYECEKK